MKQIDSYSYHLGAADCFCEMVAAGLKPIALSHPCLSAQERDEYLDGFDELCLKYHVSYYVEDEPLITDLFPVSMNLNRYNVIFYQDKRKLYDYFWIKADKDDLVEKGLYDQQARQQIAVRYGHLLGYSDEGIQRLIGRNNEKEQ